MERNDWPQAEVEYRTAIGLRTELVADKPDAAEQQSLLARDETGLAVLYCQQKRQEEAKPLLFSAADRHARLVDRHKDVPEHVMDLANACDNLASLYESLAGAAAQVEQARQKALVVVADGSGNPILKSPSISSTWRAATSRSRSCTVGQAKRKRASMLTRPRGRCLQNWWRNIPMCPTIAIRWAP